MYGNSLADCVILIMMTGFYPLDEIICEVCELLPFVVWNNNLKNVCGRELVWGIPETQEPGPVLMFTIQNVI